MSEQACLLVVCSNCDYKLGKFVPLGDSGGVGVECPGCGMQVGIHNAALQGVIKTPENYDPNDRIVAPILIEVAGD